MSHTHDVLRRLLHILESGRALNGISNDRANVYAGALREILETPQPAQPDAPVRTEALRKGLFEASDAMRVMSNWAKKPDPAGHSWAVRMIDRAQAVLNGESGIAQADAPAEARAKSISDEMMDLADRLGSEWKDVDPRAWQHLLVYAPAEAHEPIAWVTDDDRAITAAQKKRSLADGGATASSVRPYSIPCYAVSAPDDAGEARLTDAARDMLAERRRQVEAEGWTPKHDDEHDKGEMARAAACYALHAGSCFAWRADAYQSAKPHEGNPAAQDSLWPWDMQWWKPKDPRRDLVRAGALILAELERLDRAALLNEADHE